MKQKLIKLKSSSGVSILLLLLSIIGGGNPDINEDNISQYLKGDAVSVSNFIEKNLGKVVNKYNESSESENKWEANYIEKKFPILIKDSEEEYQGMFLDFDNDHGYAVVGNDYTFMSFESSGESPYKNKEGKSYAYSTSTGYFYETDEGMLSVNDENNANEELVTNAKHYDGQDYNATGCGKIVDTDKYVKDRYGSDWKIESSNSLDMDGFTQDYLSVYLENKIKLYDVNGIMKETYVPYTEGNCWFVSAYNVLQYMQKVKWTKMPSSSETKEYNPSIDEPNFYGWYYDSNGNNISELLPYNNGKSAVHRYVLHYNGTINYPKLYTNVRKCIHDVYGKYDGGKIGESCGVIEYIANEYGYYVNAVENFLWMWSCHNVVNQVNSGYPMLWFVYDDATYNNHAMAVCGYKYYYKWVKYFWFFNKKKTKLFFELRDGQEEAPRYFDISGYGGIGATITLHF